MRIKRFFIWVVGATVILAIAATFTASFAQESMSIIAPTEGYVRRGYVQYHKNDNFPTHKKGGSKCSLDISRNNGKDVYTVTDGTILEVIDGQSNTYDGGKGEISYGNFIKISHTGGIISIYGHLSEVFVSKGQSVKRGDVIGKVGNTGFSTAPHLHFEMQKNGTAYKPEPMCGKTNIKPEDTISTCSPR